MRNTEVFGYRRRPRTAVEVALDEVERRIQACESCGTRPEHDGCFLSSALQIVRDVRAARA